MEPISNSRKDMPEKTDFEEVEISEHNKNIQLRAERDEYSQLRINFDGARESKLLRKVDLRLLPSLAVFYLVAFVDRSNIGNARLQHLEADLALTPQQFSWCLTIFFFSYSLFEVPSNLVLKFLKPSIWLPIIMLSWGVTMTLMGIVQNYAGLLACRFFLGICEAGLFPACTYICTTWYRRHEVQYRVALFYSAASMSGAFSGLLAYAIGNMDGVAGMHSWRWLFILEGIVTCLIAIGFQPLIQDDIYAARWLTTEEKRYLELRLQYDGNDNGYKEGPFQWRYVIQGITDIKVYLGCIMFGAICTCTYALSYSLPTIIKLLGYTAANAQLLTIPIYVFGCILTVINAILSDRSRIRAPFIIIPMVVTMTGLIICLAVSPTKTPGAVYFALFLVAGGFYAGLPTTVTWISNNLAGQWKRATGMALQFTIGNLAGGTIGSNIFLTREAPEYRTAFAILLSFVTGSLLAGVLLRFLLNRWNIRNEGLRQTAEEEGRDLDAECGDLGDKSPNFVYTL